MINEGDLYYRQMLKSHLALVVVGRDPYPVGPTCIPFMKTEWNDMKKAPSGVRLVESLSGMTVEEVGHQFGGEPLSYASKYLLRNLNVGLLNASYAPDNAQNRQRAWETVNRRVLQHAVECRATIMLCGKSKQIAWRIRDELPLARPVLVYHPSSRIRPPESWHQWWDLGALGRFLERRQAIQERLLDP